MSIHNSYFSRNNTIVYSGETNTGRNPIIELSYADGGVKVPIGFSRCIFDIDFRFVNCTGNILRECYPYFFY